MNALLARKTLISIAQRRQKPGAGSSREFLQARTATMIWPDISDVFGELPWAVVGAVATRLYMPERMTRDLDVAVYAADVAVAREKLVVDGWVQAGQIQSNCVFWLGPNGATLVLTAAREVWWREALHKAQSNRDLQGLPILPLPYLVLMKFQAGRVNDIADITRMLGQADEAQLADTRSLFQKFETEGLEDLESLVVLGKLELEGS